MDAASGAEGEGDQAQHDDEQGAGVQEGVGTGGAADGQGQEDGDDVHQLIAGGLLDTHPQRRTPSSGCPASAYRPEWRHRAR